MSNENTGGPAFPGFDYIDQLGKKNPEGMTLRDYFAAKAMPQVMNEWHDDRENNDASASFDSDAKLMANDCYLMADAMLEARKT